MRTEGDYLIGYETWQGDPICLACSRHHDPTDYERYYSSDTDSGEVVCHECGRHLLDAAAITSANLGEWLALADNPIGGGLSMRDALRACASYIEMFTPDGVRTPPPMQFITGDGEFAAAQVFADAARAALSRP